MYNYLDRLTQDLTETNMQQFWQGFELVAYALYNKDHVYLFNHPTFQPQDRNPYQILIRDGQFNGCTLILYKNYPTAIVDLDLFSDYESLYSTLVHELFHGYQYLKGEKRFPDELKGIFYPLIKENIQLRNLERTNLFLALMTNKPDDRNQHIQTFINLREKRSDLMQEYLLYENLVESVEGPAWFVELKAFAQKSPLTYDSVIEKYAQILVDKYDSSLHLRRSCYGSGLFICLLVDEISPNWQEDFFETDQTLFDFFKERFGEPTGSIIDEIPISDETEKILNYVIDSRKRPFLEFEKQTGIHLYIEGALTLKAFDPMNITSLDDKLLHHNFLKIAINNQEFLFQQPVIAYLNGGLSKISKLHLILSNPPIETKESLILDRIGEIKGSYQKQGHNWLLFV
jgi:hypothetical protein